MALLCFINFKRKTENQKLKIFLDLLQALFVFLKIKSKTRFDSSNFLMMQKVSLAVFFKKFLLQNCLRMHVKMHNNYQILLKFVTARLNKSYCNKH